METEYSLEGLLDFLSHAADRGLMPAATAQALAVAARNVFGLLTDTEKADLRKIDVAQATQRFTYKRAADYSPATLKEYRNRVGRAIELFMRWRDDPANFKVKTRSTKASRARSGKQESDAPGRLTVDLADEPTRATQPASPDGFETSFPVRPGVVVTLSNVPDDLTKAEAERLIAFIGLLVLGGGNEE